MNNIFKGSDPISKFKIISEETLLFIYGLLYISIICYITLRHVRLKEGSPNPHPLLNKLKRNNCLHRSIILSIY